MAVITTLTNTTPSKPQTTHAMQFILTFLMSSKQGKENLHHQHFHLRFLIDYIFDTIM